MTIRWKLNLSMTALLLVLAVAGGVALYAVTETGSLTRSYSKMRELSRYTSDIRVHLYEHLATEGGVLHAMDPDGINDLTTDVLDDIAAQLRRCESDAERNAWLRVERAMQQLATINLRQTMDRSQIDEIAEQADDALWELRNYYDIQETDTQVRIATTSVFAHFTIIVAGSLILAFFLLYLSLIRKWLVRPVEVLKIAADTIGDGNLDHRVPLTGEDELSQLGRRIDAMAASLEKHQAALLEARELTSIGELCTNVAHGLRNPLAAMRACAQLAERVAADSDDAKELMQDLVKQADRMDERINKMFQFSHPGEIHPILTDFKAMADAVLSETSAFVREAQVALEVEDRTESANYELDHEQLVHALAELVRNAAYHSVPGKHVVLRGEPIKNTTGVRPGLRIQVIDQGSGMAPVTVQKAFDLFFTSRPNGTGMGLAMVRRMVERHAGSISIASERGVGTTVTIVLPGDIPASLLIRRNGIAPRLPMSRTQPRHRNVEEQTPRSTSTASPLPTDTEKK